MPGSAIAAAIAAQEATRRQRRMDQDMARRREFRRKVHQSGARAGAASERLEFPCALFCLGCGHLEPPPPQGDPMRVGPDARDQASCSACGVRAWVDLVEVTTAAALRENERRQIELRRGVPAAVAGVVAIAGVGVLSVIGFWISQIDVLMMMSMVAMSFALCWWVGRRITDARATPRRRAWRWRAPLALLSTSRHGGSGPVSGNATLIAPISGRPVLAWRVEVRYPGDRGDAFALVEQSCDALAIGGAPVGTEPRIATAACPVSAETDEARRYLASRGLDPNDRLTIVERVVVAGAAVDLWTDAAGLRGVLRDA